MKTDQVLYVPIMDDLPIPVRHKSRMVDLHAATKVALLQSDNKYVKVPDKYKHFAYNSIIPIYIGGHSYFGKFPIDISTSVKKLSSNTDQFSDDFDPIAAGWDRTDSLAWYILHKEKMPNDLKPFFSDVNAIKHLDPEFDKMLSERATKLISNFISSTICHDLLKEYEIRLKITEPDGDFSHLGIYNETRYRWQKVKSELVITRSGGNGGGTWIYLPIALHFIGSLSISAKVKMEIPLLLHGHTLLRDQGGNSFKALNALITKHLIKPGENDTKCHRLIAEIIRERIGMNDHENRKNWNSATTLQLYQRNEMINALKVMIQCDKILDIRDLEYVTANMPLPSLPALFDSHMAEDKYSLDKLFNALV